MIRTTIVLASLVTVPAAAFGHGLGAEAKLTEGQIVIEAYYDDDTPAADADVTVTDTAGLETGFGRTDSNGRWSFPSPPAGVYQFVVDAGAGHRVKLTFTVPRTADTDANLTDGPSRVEFTGPMKWAAAAAGLALIACGTLLARRLTQARNFAE